MKKTFIAALAILFGAFGASSQLECDNTPTPEDCVNELVGSGVDISNVTFNTMENQIGTFECIDCNVGMDSGIIIASGDVDVAEGPNSGGGTSLPGSNFGVTDPDLELLIPGFTLNDAAVLEFDFVATGDSIRFNYVWGSDEYPEFVNSSFNDVFGFFLSGPGITGPYSNDAINIALVPGTDLPVTIDNVNDGVNSEYYVDNSTTGNDITQIEFDGFTVVLTAEAGGLQCGETYHIKIACADAGDTAYDSAVFLEAGSFESNSVAIETGTANPPELGLNDDEVLEGCSSGWFTIYQPENFEDVTVQLSLGGTANNGEDYLEIPSEVVIPAGETTAQIELSPFYDELSEGDETVTLFYTYIDGCGDEVTVNAELIIKDYIGMTKDIDDIFLCLGSTQSIGGAPNDGQSPFSYTWSSGGGSLNEVVDNDDMGEVILTITDFCDSTIITMFDVEVASELESHPLQDFYCIGERTAVFPKEGTPPYTFPDVSDIDGLNMTEAGEFYADVPGEWTIEISDDCGESFIHELIFIACDTWIPNVMTPNSDGKNDTFFIDGIAGFAGSELTIFNRWGTIIYESVNYQNSWDGEDYPDGTYFYIFIRSDGEQFSGHFTILR